MYTNNNTVMTTKIINLKEYRENLSRLWKSAQKDQIRYIVVVHSKPVFEVRPFKEVCLQDSDFNPDLIEMKEDELTPEILKLAKQSKNMNENELVNITEKYVQD